MSKKLLIVLMSLALIGIIFVQAYYINLTVENKEEEFDLTVRRVLNATSQTIGDRELRVYVDRIKEIEQQGIVPDTTNFYRINAIQENEDGNELRIYNNTIVEENFKIQAFVDIGLDSINLSRFTNETQTQVFNDLDLDGSNGVKPTKTINNSILLSDLDKIQYESLYKQIVAFTPIHKRVSVQELNDVIDQKLEEFEIDLPNEFAIYDSDLATKVQSENFELLPENTKGVGVFLDENGKSDYILYLSFPDRKKYIISSVLSLSILSFSFMTIIIIAYGSAIYQLYKQRQISQIKTDFINNMTHEFKTPIATINLALDAIRNPKIINEEEKVKRYLKMIKDENVRMHAQVENVLRISKLEKNELSISKDRIKLHDLLLDAVAHIELIVESRNGYVKTHLDAQNTSVLANESHFTNVIVNILDNAVKYSDDEPKIDVFTENIGNSILIRIQDQGNGMSKSVQKRVFEKFYREHTGDVHNVKGHGLGLAYVKQIVDDHQGHVSIESEKGKGSTFIIKLPLIS